MRKDLRIMNKLITVVIDGPAGAGKSTIAKIIGEKFNLMYINTGSMYRAVTLKALENNISAEEVDKLLVMIDGMDMHFENDELILNGENINSLITMPNISKNVSAYASIREVRERLVNLMRKMALRYSVIMDGRDIGTVVLKDANFKFFLTASPEERADRRYKELMGKGVEVNYDEILQDIIKRDYLDSNREVDPLRKAEDAIEIDTTGIGIMGVVEKYLATWRNNMERNVILAKNAGFCFGVKRAVDEAIKYQKEFGKKIYTLGPLIHNNDVVNYLENNDIFAIELSDADSLKKGDVVLIRSHGVKESVIKDLTDKGLIVKNATCPYVTNIQLKVKKCYEQGYKIIIVGDENHPEVIGINGWCNDSAIITNGKTELENIPAKVCVVSQTTEKKETWNKVLNEIVRASKEIVAFNTICSATDVRQKKCTRTFKRG